ncbi:DUF6634 family protein [Cereibacter sediminicola]|uniref:DUF6634 family protein n=1 Tax=Cereibacter sediminicola TaxID=2584941 RepID=UPI00119DBD50|nr:DUF6634 family protein [Cereibacter sediminicola]
MISNDDFLLHLYLAAIAAAEARPTGSDLANAPCLDHWRPMLTLGGVPLLWGRVSRHPRLGDALITTSPLIALDRDEGWARTFSRWYKLGVPFDTLRQIVGPEFPQIRELPEVIGFGLPSHIPLDDPEALAHLLAARIDSIRRLARRAARH